MFSKYKFSIFRYDICELAKCHCTFLPLSLNKSSYHFIIIHFDVWGLLKMSTLGGSKWFVTFIDVCTRMTWLCLM